MSKTVIVITAKGPSAVQMSLPAPVWTGSIELGPGITRVAVYVLPDTRQVVAQTYSIWEKPGTLGDHVGAGYAEIPAGIDGEQWLALAEECDGVADALAAAGMLPTQLA